ncbi:MAG: 2-phosphosulfolactate phosphatase [Bacteroidota bacterium]
MRNIDVCPTPELLHLYNLQNTVVVVVDILRATSCMTTALAYGVEKIIPVATLEECRAWQRKGYLAAAERDAKKADGFDLDNSPFSYMSANLEGKTIAMTTTNGTLAITKSREAVKVIIGSFLNLSAITNYLLEQQYDVLVLCAGWKGKVNLEDTLFAGAVVEALQYDFAINQDTALIAKMLYKVGGKNMPAFLATSSHVGRLHKLGIHQDINFCLQTNKFNVIPVLRGNALVVL